MKKLFFYITLFTTFFINCQSNSYYSQMMILSNNDSDYKVKGTPLNTYLSNAFTYSSTIDDIDNLWAGYSYDVGYRNLPICIVMHGWSQTGNQYYGEITERIASYGYFAVSVGMRGRDGADGSKDGSAREIYDIYDAISYVKTNFSHVVNGESLVVVGWSGGGGNALAFASKFPDLAQVVVSNFGMSDYGYDLTDGWYYTNPSYSTSIETSIGDIDNKNLYRARLSLEQISNYLGYLYIFHDSEDSTVDVINSQNLDNILNENYEYSETSDLDSPRWIHATPDNSEEIVFAEFFWEDKIENSNNLKIPTNGTIKVNGFVKTKEFEIWLGDGISSEDDGRNRTAVVDYDLEAMTYNVTPVFEGSATQCEVRINQGEYTAEQIITTETLITL